MIPLDEIWIASAASMATLIASGIYSVIKAGVRKRVSIRSPESQAIEQIVPAVNALIVANGPMMTGIIAILEAQKGECNGNVDAALEINRKAKERFDRFLVDQAKVEL
jgi:hypothetical protein